MGNELKHFMGMALKENPWISLIPTRIAAVSGCIFLWSNFSRHYIDEFVTIEVNYVRGHHLTYVKKILTFYFLIEQIKNCFKMMDIQHFRQRLSHTSV